MITAGHFCISAIEQQEAISVDGQTAEIVRLSAMSDLCLLRSNHRLPALWIADYSKVKPQDPVLVIGYPQGIAKGGFTGQVMSPHYTGPIRILKGLLVVSAPSTGGISGSPVLNSAGEVIGVLVMGSTRFPHLSFAVPGDQLHRFVENQSNFRGVILIDQHIDTGGKMCKQNNKVSIPIAGECKQIDWCVHSIIAALNAAGIGTTSSCCGHSTKPGKIQLADGRVLLIAPTKRSAHQLLAK